MGEGIAAPVPTLLGVNLEGLRVTVMELIGIHLESGEPVSGFLWGEGEKRERGICGHSPETLPTEVHDMLTPESVRSLSGSSSAPTAEQWSASSPADPILIH